MDMEARELARRVARATFVDLEVAAEVVEEYLEGRDGEDLSRRECDTLVENAVANINSDTR